jgi:hypothetical protein
MKSIHSKIKVNKIKVFASYIKQEGHDGPKVAHLYIGPRSGASLNPRAFI